MGCSGDHLWDLKNSIVPLLLCGNRPCADSFGPRLGLSIWWRSGTGGSSDDSSNGDASSAGRDKEIGGGGKEGVLTSWGRWEFSWGCAQMATCFALAGEAR
jgi:hypothetical protein